MIKITLGELLNATDTLQKLAQKDFKAKLAWSISRLLKAAEKEVQEFNEARMNLIKKYGMKDEQNELITDEKGNCKITDENINEFSTELNDLIATEVEINANKMSLDLFDDAEFSPSDMVLLEPFIETEE